MLNAGLAVGTLGSAYRLYKYRAPGRCALQLVGMTSVWIGAHIFSSYWFMKFLESGATRFNVGEADFGAFWSNYSSSQWHIEQGMDLLQEYDASNTEFNQSQFAKQ